MSTAFKSYSLSLQHCETKIPRALHKGYHILCGLLERKPYTAPAQSYWNKVSVFFLLQHANKRHSFFHHRTGFCLWGLVVWDFRLTIPLQWVFFFVKKNVQEANQFKIKCTVLQISHYNRCDRQLLPNRFRLVDTLAFVICLSLFLLPSSLPSLHLPFKENRNMSFESVFLSFNQVQGHLHLHFSKFRVPFSPEPDH